MSTVRGTPSIGWSAAAIGGAIAIASALVGGVGIASVLGALIGGAVASRVAGHHGALQGGAAAAVFIVVIGLLDSFSVTPRLPPDTVLLIVLDTLHLAVGALGGWLALRR